MTSAGEEKKKISFGDYFDAQCDRLREMLKNKNTQLNNEWRERYDERKKNEKATEENSERV